MCVLKSAAFIKLFIQLAFLSTPAVKIVKLCQLKPLSLKMHNATVDTIGTDLS